MDKQNLKFHVVQKPKTVHFLNDWFWNETLCHKTKCQLFTEIFEHVINLAKIQFS
jgi:hypothetical protein